MYRYIVVDDESLIRKGIIKKLEAMDELVHCAGEAANGREAIALIRAEDPHIIITDMSMPVMDGTQMLPYVTEHYPAKRLIVISSYKEYEYMKHAITAGAVDYILKPFSREELQESVSKAIALIANNADLQNQLEVSEVQTEQAHYEYDVQMLANLVLGHRSSSTEITSNQLAFLKRPHQMALVTIHSPGQLNGEELRHFLEQNGYGDLALYLHHVHSCHLGFLLLSAPSGTPSTARIFCDGVLEKLEQAFCLEHNGISLGISGMHRSYLELHTAFEQTVEALNAKVAGDNCKRFYYSTISSELHPVEWERQEELYFRLESGMSDKLEELLDDLFAHFARHGYTLGDTKLYCFGMVDKVKGIMAEYIDQVNPYSVSSSMREIVDEMFSLRELKNYFLQFFMNISTLLAEKNVYADVDGTVEKIKLYIRRNYANKLSVELISSLFYLNRSYCSHLFKKTTGESLVDYTNRVRVEEAQRLLWETDRKLYQIARTVGYDNVKYFFRIFKKVTGETPEQYRNRKRSLAAKRVDV